MRMEPLLLWRKEKLVTAGTMISRYLNLPLCPRYVHNDNIRYSTCMCLRLRPSIVPVPVTAALKSCDCIHTHSSFC